MKFTASSAIFAVFAFAATSRVHIQVVSADSSEVNGGDHHDGSETNGGHGHGDDDHAWMEQSDATIVAYCARPCPDVTAGTSITDVDPCGDGRGQLGFCSPVVLEEPTAYGYGTDEGTVPTTFIGCTHAVCETSCANVNSTVADDGTLCFPCKATMDGMYKTKDDAELSAVARGCSGSHSMGEMVMVGSTHPACSDSYSKEGIPLGTVKEDEEEEDSDASPTSAASASSTTKAAIIAGVVGTLLTVSTSSQM